MPVLNQKTNNHSYVWLTALTAAFCLLAFTIPKNEGRFRASTRTERRTRILNGLRDSITRQYGYLNGGARINQGPCAAFALMFHEEWNKRFAEKVSVCVVLSPDRSEAFHAMVRLPDGSAYDGGRGVIPPEQIRRLLGVDVLQEFREPDVPTLESYFGRLDRKYPRCPLFDLSLTRGLITNHLQRLQHKES